MSALDAATRPLLREEIKKIRKNFQSAMAYVTHDQEEAFAMSDRIMVMNQGCIADGYPGEYCPKSGELSTSMIL
jgi:ABC-type Fe3+/spermidine/putrescine transport system ATPase subunit